MTATPLPPSDRSDLVAMGDWVADCLDAEDQLVRRSVVRRLVDEVEALRSVLVLARDGLWLDPTSREAWQRDHGDIIVSLDGAQWAAVDGAFADARHS